jgi:hypothetical protein
MLLLLLALAVAGAAAGEPLAAAGLGLTPIVLLAGYRLTVGVSSSDTYLPRWRPEQVPALELLERRDRTVLGMGIDSAAVLVVYPLGLAGLYFLR